MIHWNQQKNIGVDNQHNEVMPIIGHVLALRSALLNTFICFCIIFICCFFFAENIILFLLRPIKYIFSHQNFVYTSIAEPISTEFKIVSYVSLFLTYPILFFNLWNFAKPGLILHEKKIFKFIICSSFILFAMGAIFAWYIAIPKIILMLKSFGVAKHAVFLPSIALNIQFIISVILAFGISFQIPIIMIFLDKTGIIKISKQKKLWREYFLLITIISAIITPPDITSMLFMMLPMLVLYFGTILLYKIICK